jgi:DNA-binding IclR family transcriptional regulator
VPFSSVSDTRETAKLKRQWPIFCWKRAFHYCIIPINLDDREMKSNLKKQPEVSKGAALKGVVLTDAQAACLDLLQNGDYSKNEIALGAKLNLKRTSGALAKLNELGLVRCKEKYRWYATALGKKTSFKLVPLQKRQSRKNLGPSAQALLEALECPKYVRELANDLNLTRQRIHQLAIDLHARGDVKFGVDKGSFRIVARADDPTILLSRGEERVLSTLPNKYGVRHSQISSAAGMPKHIVRETLNMLVVAHLVKVEPGIDNDELFAITQEGTKHPQYNIGAKCAERPRLPVQSERVFNVLTLLSNEGTVRIKEVSRRLAIRLPSINSLFQNLRSKNLVEKVSRHLRAPYALTDRGRHVLFEWKMRRNELSES